MNVRLTFLFSLLLVSTSWAHGNGIAKGKQKSVMERKRCGYYEQLRAINCASRLFVGEWVAEQRIQPIGSSIDDGVLGQPLHPHGLVNVELLCRRYSQFENCAEPLSDDCRSSVVGTLVPIYRLICKDEHMRSSMSAEQKCLERMATDVQLNSCYRESMLRDAANNGTADNGTAADSASAAERRADDAACVNMQNYLDCAAEHGYFDECKNAVRLKMAVFAEIKPICSLEVKQAEPERIVPTCDDNGLCHCAEGYSFEPRNHKCNDVNECDLSTAACSQKCVNTIGSYECLCDLRYYELDADNVTCVRRDKSAQWIFFAHGQSIWNITEDGEHFQLMRAALQKTAMIEVDVKTKQLYYADIGANKLQRVGVEGGFPQTIQSFEVDGLEGIAIDWIGRNLYSLRKANVFVQQLDGKHRKKLYSGVMKLPRALVAHPSSGYLYMTEWSSEAFIGRAAMDGGSFEKLITGGLVWPNGLAIDHYAERIYWGDAFLDTIESADLLGRRRRTVVAESGNVPHVFALAVADDRLFWTDWTYRGILRADKRRGDNVTVLAQTALLPYGIKIYHSVMQPDGVNPCVELALNCSQLCLLSPANATSAGGNGSQPVVGAKCACSDGFRLEADSRTCSSNCSDKQLLCGGSDPRCISRVYRCDGVGQCRDRSDEIDCPPRICLPGQFQCEDNRKCLVAGDVCNGTSQCDDDSDEKYC